MTITHAHPIVTEAPQHHVDYRGREFGHDEHAGTPAGKAGAPVSHKHAGIDKRVHPDTGQESHHVAADETDDERSAIPVATPNRAAQLAQIARRDLEAE